MSVYDGGASHQDFLSRSGFANQILKSLAVQ